MTIFWGKGGKILKLSVIATLYICTAHKNDAFFFFILLMFVKAKFDEGMSKNLLNGCIDLVMKFSRMRNQAYFYVAYL